MYNLKMEIIDTLLPDLFSCEEAALEGQKEVCLSVCLTPKLNLTFHLLDVNL